MYSIKKDFVFSAAHHLMGLPEDHPCTTPHGHNYKVTVELRSLTLNPVGFVKDYRELDPMKKFIDTTLDHKDLNEVLNINPTAELLAKYLYDQFHELFPQLYSVTVSETEKTSATYLPHYDC